MKKPTPRLIAAVCTLLIFSACEKRPPIDNIVIDISGVHLSIPRHLVVDVGSLSVHENDTKVDSDHDVLVRVPVDVLNALDSANGWNIWGPTLRIYAVSVDSGGRVIWPQFFDDLWYGKGLFENRVVQFQERTGLFSVRASNKIKKSWHYLRVNPADGFDQSGDYQKHWVASCWVSESSDQNESLRSVCTAVAYDNEIAVEFSFPGHRIGDIVEAKKRLVALIRSWRL